MVLSNDWATASTRVTLSIMKRPSSCASSGPRRRTRCWRAWRCREVLTATGSELCPTGAPGARPNPAAAAARTSPPLHVHTAALAHAGWGPRGPQMPMAGKDPALSAPGLLPWLQLKDGSFPHSATHVLTTWSSTLHKVAEHALCYFRRVLDGPPGRVLGQVRLGGLQTRPHGRKTGGAIHEGSREACRTPRPPLNHRAVATTSSQESGTRTLCLPPPISPEKTRAWPLPTARPAPHPENQEFTACGDHNRHVLGDGGNCHHACVKCCRVS